MLKSQIYYLNQILEFSYIIALKIKTTLTLENVKGVAWDQQLYS